MLAKAFVYLLASTAAIPAAAQQADPSTGEQTIPATGEQTSLPAGEQTNPPSAQTESANTGIQDVIVTAQRRGENVQDVPISITAVTSETLEASGITSTTDVMRVAPGLQFQQAIGLAAPYIRGLGVSNQAAGVESSVATYVDGVYIASGGDALMSLNNIDRIEVLRGPQGTLFGRNSTGGLVHIITRTPQYTPEAEASISYDQWQTITASSYVTGGLTDQIAIDFAMRYSGQGQGWGENRNTGKELNKVNYDFSTRAKLLFEPSETTKLVVAGDYSEFKGSTYVVFTPVPGHLALGNVLFTGDRWDAISTFENPYRASENWGVSADFAQELGFANLRSITAYRRSIFDAAFDPGSLPTPTVTIIPHIENRQFSQELQILSPDSSSIRWIAGLYYFRNNSAGSSQDVLLYPPVTFAPGPIFSHQDLSHKVTSLAAFAQATVPITSQLDLTAGLRMTRDKFTYLNAETLNLTFVPQPFNIVSNPETTRKDTQSKPSWRFALDYQATADSLFYASYTRGFKSGGYDAYERVGEVLDPEIIDSYEVGTKLDMLDRALRFNTSVFYYKVKNLQVALLDQGTSNLRNAASAAAYGLEAEITAIPLPGLTLKAAGNYLHSRYKDFRGNAPITIPRPGGGNDIIEGDASGNQTARTPDKTFSLSANYQTPFAGGELGLHASGFWSAKWYADPDNRLFQPAYELIAGEVSWTDPSGHLRFRVFGRNLTNSKVTAQFGSLAMGDVRSLTEPRTIGAGVGFKF